MTAIEATIGEFIPVPFFTNIRGLTIACKQEWPFPRFAKLNAFFWLDLIKLLSFLADNILSSHSKQRNTNHPCMLHVVIIV